MSNEAIGAVTAIRRYFSTPEKPVATEEVQALGTKAILELGPLCAEALGRPYQPPQGNKSS